MPESQTNFIEATIPDKPTSRLQQYRLSKNGSSVLEQLKQHD